MKRLTFFTKGRGGSMSIRARQVAEYLGEKVNPEKGYKNDICIYVKFEPPEDFPKNSYLDVVDEPRRVKWLKKHPNMGVIASSLTSYEYLTKTLGRKVVLIPQHHCNYDREISKGSKIGVVGGKGAIQADIPVDHIHYGRRGSCRTREDVVSAYKNLGVQIIWRLQQRPLKNPLKIINAMSFGIPTVAFPEIGYKEMEGYYTRANTVDELVFHAKRLVETGLTDVERKRLVKKAEEYHIDNIAKLYKKLK